ncbi:MAG: CHAP domain-containing protein [Chloroflexi bacterium]|nr:MAG: CHAP domain-containing protein [Chloroflexota bacterium]
MVTAGSCLHRLETGAAGGVPHDLRGALAVYGGSPAYADQVLSLATPPVQLAGLPVVFPILAPGWVRRIATPRWPADLAAHMSPSGVTHQCVAGALATWALMHPADPRWDHPPPLFGNAIDLFGVARAEGFQLDSHPTPGAMVVYGRAYGVFGHIGTVRAVQGNRYEVVEQNFLEFDPQLEPHWATFDLRSVAWPDPAVVTAVMACPPSDRLGRPHTARPRKGPAVLRVAAGFAGSRRSAATPGRDQHRSPQEGQPARSAEAQVAESHFAQQAAERGTAPELDVPTLVERLPVAVERVGDRERQVLDVAVVGRRAHQPAGRP